MRTTVEISDQLFRQAKKRAADEGIPLRAVVEEALRVYLSQRPRGAGYRLS
jgi:predicted DNA binding CopG/RHH family protein